MKNLLVLSLLNSALFTCLSASAAPPDGIIVNKVSKNNTHVMNTAGHISVAVAPANQHGVSHNAYDKFNVGKSGITLDNMTSGAAVIINEVVSKSKSFLHGNIHVAGKEAHLIIANPNGIVCNGCSTSGVSRVTLSGGNISMASEGEFSGFRNIGGKILLKNVAENHFAGIDKMTLAARAIEIDNSHISTPDLEIYSGRHDLTTDAGGIRGYAAQNSGWRLDDISQENSLTVRKNSHILADNMYIHAVSSILTNRGKISVMPENTGNPVRTNNQLTLSLIGSVLQNTQSAGIHAYSMNSVLANSHIENAGTFQTDTRHNMIVMGNSYLHNRGDMSADTLGVSEFGNIASGFELNNDKNLSSNIKINTAVASVKNTGKLTAETIRTDNEKLFYENTGNIENETAHFSAYELYHSDNGRITSRPKFEYELKYPLPLN